MTTYPKQAVYELSSLMYCTPIKLLEFVIQSSNIDLESVRIIDDKGCVPTFTVLHQVSYHILFIVSFQVKHSTQFL